MSRQPVTLVARRAHRATGSRIADRDVPEEVPVALSYGGTTHAVMMATPADLEDFAFGFSLTEGIVEDADGIESIDILEAGAGIDIQIRLANAASGRFEARRRRLAGPVGCGLCGIESIDEAMRTVPDVAGSSLRLSALEIARSVEELSRCQPMHKATGAVHAAGFFSPQGGIVMVREDVGRHNALDKLAGGLFRSGHRAPGAVVVTSRVSVEMVQKAAMMGAGAIIAVSAPTALAIRTAEQCGMTLVALVRGGEFDVFTHAHRIELDGKQHVA